MISRIKRHRQRKHGGGHYALVPFIDMMTILVVFLLAHTAEVDILPNTKNISIPQSISDRKPDAAVVVMVTKDQLFVDGQLVGSVSDLVANQGPFFAPLKTAFTAQNDRTRVSAVGGAALTIKIGLRARLLGGEARARDPTLADPAYSEKAALLGGIRSFDEGRGL